MQSHPARFPGACLTGPPPQTDSQPPSLTTISNVLSSLNWSNVTSGIQDDGTTKTLLVNPPTGNRFYRLHKP